MNIIVLDLEWNQANGTSEQEVPAIPFEIVEIGAVKLKAAGTGVHGGLDAAFCQETSSGENSAACPRDQFSCLVRPSVYHEMNQITGKLIHLRMKELKKGSPFPEAAGAFLDWCGEEEYRFGSWGSSDLTELQRNMAFYHMPPLSDGPLAFWDVQKLFSIAFEDGKSRKSLEYAVDFLELEKDIPFHRALSDAYYTAKILERILAQKPQVLKNLSYDVFHPPKDRKSELKVQFDNYAKYISREFDSREEAFADKEVASSKCYLCRRNLRKKIRWFSPNGRHYICLAYCEKHGYLKGKIRVRKSPGGRVYVVKTTKLISPEDAEALRSRRKHVSDLQKNRDSRKRGMAHKR
ncbi:MAG: exonuclease domain-containing protein [Lachnospiraceae bacterium]|nr:exonuclease domain-containing protein [Lachnospiraceae bacterium]